MLHADCPLNYSRSTKELYLKRRWEGHGNAEEILRSLVEKKDIMGMIIYRMVIIDKLRS